MNNFRFVSYLLVVFILMTGWPPASAQLLRLPDPKNLKCLAGRTVGTTDIEVRWSAPGVKGREGKIWGTDVAWYGTQVLGFGSDVASPWRAGADECTTISFSTDVMINGKKLAAGKYAFFIELAADSCVLIFNRNHEAWGSYFYQKDLDVLRVTTKQQKNAGTSKERLDYTFDQQTEKSVVLALEWEYWKIPFTVEIDLTKNVLTSIRTQMSGAMGFDPSSLVSAATWCLQHDINLEQALTWITSATDPFLGGISNFNALSTKAAILTKLNQPDEAAKLMQQAMNNATALELHSYGRKLLSENKVAEAMVVFEKNYQKNNGQWPTHVGLMRGYSASGNLPKALEHAKLALAQAPDDINRKSLEKAVKTLEEGKAL